MNNNVGFQAIGQYFSGAAAACAENPIKIYSSIFFFGDLILGANPNGSSLWLVGAVFAAAANANKMSFGKGGDRVDAETFRITKEGLFQTARDTAILPFRFLTRDHWREVRQSLTGLNSGDLWKKASRVTSFWRYPLDAGWLGYILAGACYVTDALAEGPPRFGDAILGGAVALASAYGFLTDNTNITGRMFGLVCLYSLCVGAATRNPALIGSSLVYMYGSYTMSRSIAARQSSFVIQAAPKAASNG